MSTEQNREPMAGVGQSGASGSHQLTRDWMEGEECSLTRRWQGGEIVVEGQIAQGGDTLWTSWVIKTQLGRPKKNGVGRVAGKTLNFIMLPRTITRDEALRHAAAAFERFVRSEDSRLPVSDFANH